MGNIDMTGPIVIYSDMSTEQLLVWAKDHLEYITQQEWFDPDKSCAPELIDRINQHLED